MTHNSKFSELDNIKLDDLEINRSLIGECGEWTVVRYEDYYVVCPPLQGAYEISDLEELKDFLRGSFAPNAKLILI